MINFHLKNFFVGTTPTKLCTLSFVRLIFVAAIDYKNIFMMKMSALTGTKISVTHNFDEGDRAGNICSTGD